MEIREPVRTADKYYLIMRRVGAGILARIEISEAEHNLSYDACEAKVRSEDRLPNGLWEKNDGGAVRLGGVMTFDGTANGNLEPGDAYYDEAAGRLLIHVESGKSLLEFDAETWAISRGQTGITVRTKTGNLKPKSVEIENGNVAVIDLDMVRENHGRG